MNKKNILFKIVAILLSISLFMTVAGCKKDDKPTQSTSSDVTSTNKEDVSENQSSEEEITSSDLNSDLDSDLDLDLDSDLDLDFSDDFIFDFTVSQTVKFDNKAEQQNYSGLMGVLPCFWFVPDKTMQFQYTEEEIEISVKKFLQMGVSIVRCLSLEPAYSWDSKNDKWDWDSDWITGFYKYCDIMQKNGIEVIVNTAQGVTGYTSYLGLENPLYLVAKANNPQIFDKFDEKNVTDDQRTAIAKEYGNWLVDFYNEVVVKRGYTCVKYFEPATEPNNSMESRPLEDVRKVFDSWAINLKACHDAMVKAGIRDKIKFVGPSAVHATESANPWTANQFMKWCVDEYDYAIDIYAAHSYAYGASMSDDLTHNFDSLIKECYDIVKPTGKPFWCDEFNALTQAGKYIESSNDANHGTQIALGYGYQMLKGINGTCLWYISDIKWPNSNATTPPSWVEGIHQLGLDTSILESTIPRKAYYAYCMLGTAIKQGDTVYAGEATEEGLFSILLEHNDGTHSIVVINLSWNDNEITYEFSKKLNAKKFDKLVYNPLTITPTTEYKPIEPSAEIKCDNNTFSDTVGAYQVVVYNQK